MSNKLKSDGCLQIAGKFTVADWKLREETLEPGRKSDDWKGAIDDFFMERLKTRYFDPIELLIDNDQKAGEGFAIVALQCSLIEFLASIRTGQRYKHCSNNKSNGDSDAQCGKYEYCQSSKLFIDFLSGQQPFNEYFASRTKANEFYKNVRCALLHEARTKGGWKIHAKETSFSAIDVAEKIIDRNKLQCAFKKYVKNYGKELTKDKTLQEAFILKFDSLCEE